MITQLSGRGLGLAIVREKTEKLGGRVSDRESPRLGTTIRMTLPLTLATFRGVLIEAAQRLFIVPTAQVERVDALQAARRSNGRRPRERLRSNGRAVALARPGRGAAIAATRQRPERPAGDAGRSSSARASSAWPSRWTRCSTSRKCWSSGSASRLSRVRNIAGATVLGSGQVAPILNVPDLLKSARTGGATRACASAPDSRRQRRPRRFWSPRTRSPRACC